MAIPDFQTLMLPILKLLKNDNTVKLSEMVNVMSDKYNLTEEERNEWLPSRVQKTMYNRVAWAKQYLKNYGLINSPEKGSFQITQKGKDLLETKPKKIDLRLLKSLNNNIIQSKLPIVEPESIENEQATPDEMIENAKQILMSHLENDLLEKLLSKDPTFFEKTVVKLICKMGYGGSESDIEQSCGKAGDGGIDGVIKQDTLGLDKIYIQAKRYAIDNSVSRPDIQKFLWVVHKKASKGIFITTSYFTKESIEEAKQGNVVLIDGKNLTKLMIEYNLGVQPKTIIEIKKIDNDFFEDEE